MNNRRQEDMKMEEVIAAVHKNNEKIEKVSKKLEEHIEHNKTHLDPIAEVWSDVAAVGRMGKRIKQFFLFAAPIGLFIIAIHEWITHLGRIK